MGTSRHDLPSGGWVDLADEYELTGMHYRLAYGAVTDFTKAGAWRMEMRSALLAHCVRNWSFEHLPLPADAKPEDLAARMIPLLDRLPLGDIGQLHNLIMPHYNLMLGISVTPNPDGHDDDASPTAGSSE